jgi:hypothetical protein
MFISRLLIWMLCLCVSGCVTNVQQNAQHVELIPLAQSSSSSAANDTITIERSVAVPVSHGFIVRDLKAPSTWKRIGTIPQGDVYKPIDAVLMVEGGDNHEGMLVVNSNNNERRRQIVGVYMPVESAFTPTQSPVDLPTNP